MYTYTAKTKPAMLAILPATVKASKQSLLSGYFPRSKLPTSIPLARDTGAVFYRPVMKTVTSTSDENYTRLKRCCQALHNTL